MGKASEEETMACSVARMAFRVTSQVDKCVFRMSRICLCENSRASLRSRSSRGSRLVSEDEGAVLSLGLSSSSTGDIFGPK